MKKLIIPIILAATAATGLAQNRADRAASTLGSAARTRAALDRPIAEEIAPELFRGEMEDVGPQFLLAPDPKATATLPEHRWIDVLLDAQLGYTSNALLTEKGNSDTSLMILTAQAAVNLPPFEFASGRTDVKAGYRHQLWLYSLNDTGSGLNDFDFTVSTLFINARHTLSEEWSGSFGLDYNRLLSHDDDHAEFYTEFVSNWNVERTWAFGESSALVAGYYGGFHWTNTDDVQSDINDRLDTAFGLTFTHELRPGLIVQPFYRAQWSHYTTNADRNDFYNTVGTGLVWIINDWASLRTFISYENRNSTDDTVADYGKWDAGGGVSVNVKF